jgi:sugar/nucleoside kinase (ribokinase family)
MMSKVLVSGLINIETTLKVDTFPLEYQPVRYPFFGINSTVSGVGYNIARALTVLGDEVAFASLIGDDLAASQVRTALAADGIDDSLVLSAMPATAQSVIIYNREGKRQIHTDLKDIQERKYPAQLFGSALSNASLAILCNIGYNRPFLTRANQAGIPVATDVHTASSISDAYNADYMAAANILFLSDELLPCSPEMFAQQLQERYGTAVIVIGLGEQGALLAVRDDNFRERVPAVKTRPVVNTIGAGDALFSSFNYYYGKKPDPYEAIQKAVIFASYKIGEAGAAEGFLSADELEKLADSI